MFRKTRHCAIFDACFDLDLECAGSGIWADPWYIRDHCQHSKAINSSMIRHELQLGVIWNTRPPTPKSAAFEISAEMVLTFQKQLVTTPSKHFISIPCVDESDIVWWTSGSECWFCMVSSLVASSILWQCLKWHLHRPRTAASLLVEEVVVLQRCRVNVERQLQEIAGLNPTVDSFRNTNTADPLAWPSSGDPTSGWYWDLVLTSLSPIPNLKFVQSTSDTMWSPKELQLLWCIMTSCSACARFATKSLAPSSRLFWKDACRDISTGFRIFRLR